jgi:hypothetical protein
MANLSSLASGLSVTLLVTEQQQIVLNNAKTSVARLQIVTGPGAGTVVTASHNGRRVYGPFGAGTIMLFAISGDLRYELSGDSVSPMDDDGQPLIPTENMVVRSLVYGSNDVSDLVAPGLLSGVTYDASNRATQWTIDGVTYSASYTSSAITVAGTDGTITNISVDPAQRITAVATA